MRHEEAGKGLLLAGAEVRVMSVSGQLLNFLASGSYLPFPQPVDKYIVVSQNHGGVFSHKIHMAITANLTAIRKGV